jgi:hypothetical protein
MFLEAITFAASSTVLSASTETISLLAMVVTLRFRLNAPFVSCASDLSVRGNLCPSPSARTSNFAVEPIQISLGILAAKSCNILI